MGNKNKLIPFEWLPASWGLAGAPFDEAKAYYELDGEDLERRLIDIRYAEGSIERDHEYLKLNYKYDRLTDYDYEIEEATLLGSEDELDPKIRLDIDKRFGKISPYEYDLKLAEINFPDLESLDRQMAMLTADYDHGKIERLEYEKTMATAKNEPWVGVVDDGYDHSQGVNGLSIELDWNPQWIGYLKKHGYQGVSDEQIVDQWFSDVCRSTAEENPLDARETNEPIPFNSGRVINNRVRKDDGTEYRS